MDNIKKTIVNFSTIEKNVEISAPTYAILFSLFPNTNFLDSSLYDSRYFFE